VDNCRNLGALDGCPPTIDDGRPRFEACGPDDHDKGPSFFTLIQLQ
jgi:hypothetical protein